MKKYKDLDRILLIDDDAATNFIHRKIVENTSIHVDVKEISSAKEALDYLTCSGDYADAKEAPNAGIIFLDINMPGMNGWDFMEEYSKLDEQQRARIVVVMVTTSLNPDDQLHAAVFKDIVTYLPKPLSTAAVADIAEKYFTKIS
jgi:CheY-like chemotaxis protein